MGNQILKETGFLRGEIHLRRKTIKQNNNMKEEEFQKKFPNTFGWTEKEINELEDIEIKREKNLMWGNMKKEIYTDLERPLMNSKPLMNDMFYYTPNITDFYIGYECEANITLFKVKDEWRPCTLKGVGQEVVEYHKQGVYRTRYLTKQDIEDQGWELNSIKNLYHKKGILKEEEIDFQLFYNENSKWLLIFAGQSAVINWQDKQEIHTNNTLFAGRCSSINELRTIEKLLQI